MLTVSEGAEDICVDRVGVGTTDEVDVWTSDGIDDDAVPSEA